jgi:hypothetical protein
MTYQWLEQDLKTEKTCAAKGSFFVQFQSSKNRVEVAHEFTNFVITAHEVTIDTSILDFRQNPKFLKGVSRVLVLQKEKNSPLTIELQPKSAHSKAKVLKNFFKAFVFNEEGFFVKEENSWFLIDTEEISQGCGKLEHREMILKRSENGLAAIKIKNEIEGKLWVKQMSDDSWKEYQFNKADFLFKHFTEDML